MYSKFIKLIVLFSLLVCCGFAGRVLYGRFPQLCRTRERSTSHMINMLIQRKVAVQYHAKIFKGITAPHRFSSQGYIDPIDGLTTKSLLRTKNHKLFFKFKGTFVLIITYKALHGLSPKYISDLLTLKRSSRILRSNYQDSLKLETPTFKTKNYGGKAFSVCAPRLWNDLPRDLRNSPSLETFKRGLKTYLFNQ